MEDGKTMNENEKKAGSKVFLVCLFFIVGVAGGVVGFLISDKFLDKDEVKDVDKANKNDGSGDDNKPAEQSPYERFLTSEIANRTDKVIEKSEESGYEIRLTKSGDVIANVKASTEDVKDIVDQVIENKVVKFFIVNVGQGDVGDNRELVFIKEDGSVTSVSLGDLLISCEIKINKNYALKNITEVYEKEALSESEYEPPIYTVFVKDIDGNETEITKLIKDNRN